jgi:hypothetical protein
VSDDGRIPLWIAEAPMRAPRRGLALILTSEAEPPPGYAIVRHAEAAAIAEAGGCACCRVPSDLVTMLRRLFLERVRGETSFVGLVVEGAPALIEPALADPLIAARYEYHN